MCFFMVYGLLESRRRIRYIFYIYDRSTFFIEELNELNASVPVGVSIENPPFIASVMGGVEQVWVHLR